MATAAEGLGQSIQHPYDVGPEVVGAVADDWLGRVRQLADFLVARATGASTASERMAISKAEAERAWGDMEAQMAALPVAHVAYQVQAERLWEGYHRTMPADDALAERHAHGDRYWAQLEGLLTYEEHAVQAALQQVGASATHIIRASDKHNTIGVHALAAQDAVQRAGYLTFWSVVASGPSLWRM